MSSFEELYPMSLASVPQLSLHSVSDYEDDKLDELLYAPCDIKMTSISSPQLSASKNEEFEFGFMELETEVLPVNTTITHKFAPTDYSYTLPTIPIEKQRKSSVTGENYKLWLSQSAC